MRQTRRVRIKTCQSLGDIMAIRQYLLDSYSKIGYLYNWEPRRWEGKLFHRNTQDLLKTREAISREVAILLNDEGQIQGVAIPEYDGGVFLQTQPDDTATQEILVDWSLENLSQKTESSNWLEIWCNENDETKKQLLDAKGFKPTSEHQIKRNQSLTTPKPLPELPNGYVVRSVNESDEDYQKMAALLNAAFNRDFHSAEEYRNFATLAPSYKSELEIVVQAPNGDFAAHAGFTAHDVESFVVVEPVCTHPDHQNLGLARIAIAEGLNRCLEMGIKTAFIEAWYSNPVSNHVYQQMGFGKPISQYIWRKEF